MQSLAHVCDRIVLVRMPSERLVSAKPDANTGGYGHECGQSQKIEPTPRLYAGSNIGPARKGAICEADAISKCQSNAQHNLA